MLNRKEVYLLQIKALVVVWLGLASLSGVAQNSPVTYQHIVRHNPNYSIHVVTIDLADPRVAVHVARAGAPSPDDGKWVTTLLPTSEIANREHFDIAINGDFFGAKATKDIEGKNTGFVRGKPASPVGLAMTDGKIWHDSYLPRPYLEITAGHVAKLAERQPHDPIDPNAWEIIGGGQIIVQNGQPVIFTNKFGTTKNPRTVVGMDATGKHLTLFIVDGRQPSLSIGMTLDELSKEMIALGCNSAINLDGGGSTTLVYRDPGTKQLRIVNLPSDTRERSVADVLGVTVDAPLPELK
jgi:exopolysaccharide biosynthesis protein